MKASIRKFSQKLVLKIFIAILLLGICGCGGMRPTVFLHNEFDFNFIEKVAVIPFDNLSKDQGAGDRATRIFISELLAAKAFDVLEPGEVSRVLEQNGIVRTDELSREQLVKIGSEMKVNALFLGAVTESDLIRGGGSNDITVAIIARMVEVEAGSTIWSVTQNSNNSSFWSSLFGSRKKSHSEVMRSCIKSLLKTLVK